MGNFLAEFIKLFAGNWARAVTATLAVFLVTLLANVASGAFLTTPVVLGALIASLAVPALACILKSRYKISSCS